MRRRNLKKETKKEKCIVQESMEIKTENIDLSEEIIMRKTYDKKCQVNFILNCEDPGKTFICNRYVNVATATDNVKIINEVEIQTDIVLTSAIVIPSQKKMKNKQCNTITKVYVDEAVNVTSEELDIKRSFNGYVSVKKEDQLLDLARVRFNTSEF